jgi:NAD(P)-dependent dehydrogenase (short-subunit alcohol dehydrogenase family)
VTIEKQVKSTVDQVVKKFGTVDILVNNAGGAHITAPIEELTSPAEKMRIFEKEI